MIYVSRRYSVHNCISEGDFISEDRVAIDNLVFGTRRNYCNKVIFLQVVEVFAFRKTLYYNYTSSKIVIYCTFVQYTIVYCT